MTKRNRYALLVGTNRFSDQSLRQLLTPEQDIKQLAKVLEDPLIGDYEVKSILNGNSWEINREIERFYKKAQVDDTLLLYYSGHGLRDGLTGELHLATTDTEKEILQTTSISASSIRRWIHHSRASRMVLILDSCFSGAISDRMLTMGEPVNIKQHFQGTGVAILTASSAFQFAYENENIETIRLNRESIFTRFLVQGLATGAAGTIDSPYITIQQLFSFIQHNFNLLSPEIEINQTPELTVVSQQGEIIIAINPNPLANYSKLPSQIVEDSRSQFTYRRKAAVGELARIIDEDKNIAHIAYTLLQELSHDDSREVSAEATEAIKSTSPDQSIIPSAARLIESSSQTERRYIGRPLRTVLSFDNIYDYIELFRWIFSKPDVLRKYKEKLNLEEQKELLKRTIWLSSTLTWGPILILSILAELLALTQPVYEFKLWRIIIILTMWILTGIWGAVLEDTTAWISIAISGVTSFLIAISTANITMNSFFAFLFSLAIFEVSLYVTAFQKIALSANAFAVGIMGIIIGCFLMLGSVPVAFGGRALETAICVLLSIVGVGLAVTKTRNDESITSIVLTGGLVGAIAGVMVYIITGRFTSGDISLSLSSIFSCVAFMLVYSSIIYQAFDDFFRELFE